MRFLNPLLWLRSIYRFFVWLADEQDKICPICGYYCTGKYKECLPPKDKLETEGE